MTANPDFDAEKAGRARIDGLLVDRGQMMAELEGCADTIKALTEKNISLSARLAALTGVSEEDVERVARQAMDETDGDEAWFDATPHNRTRVRSIVRAALTAFVSR